jgi:plasmid stabilization system protein ParE
MAEIVWTQEAVQWLEEIFEYVAGENPHAAGSVTSGIFDRAQILRDFPQIG